MTKVWALTVAETQPQSWRWLKEHCVGVLVSLASALCTLKQTHTHTQKYIIFKYTYKYVHRDAHVCVHAHTQTHTNTHSSQSPPQPDYTTWETESVCQQHCVASRYLMMGLTGWQSLCLALLNLRSQGSCSWAANNEMLNMLLKNIRLTYRSSFDSVMLRVCFLLWMCKLFWPFNMNTQTVP